MSGAVEIDRPHALRVYNAVGKRLTTLGPYHLRRSALAELPKWKRRAGMAGVRIVIEWIEHGKAVR